MEISVHNNLARECGFGLTGYCCPVCSLGPCRVDPFGDPGERGRCGFSRDQMALAQLLTHLLVESAGAPEGVGCSGTGESPAGVTGVESTVPGGGDYIPAILSWIARGASAGTGEGLSLLLDFSRYLVLQRAGKGCGLQESRGGEEWRDKVFLIRGGLCPEEEGAVSAIARDPGKTCPVDIEYLAGLLAGKRPGEGGAGTVLVQGGRTGRCLSTILGLAACGFTVFASLPLQLLAGKILRSGLDDLLSVNCSGRLFDYSEISPGEKG